MAIHTPMGEPEKLILATIHGWLDEQAEMHPSTNMHEQHGGDTWIHGRYDLSALVEQITTDLRARMTLERPTGRHSEYWTREDYAFEEMAAGVTERALKLHTGDSSRAAGAGAHTEVNSSQSLQSPSRPINPPVLGRGLLENDAVVGMDVLDPQAVHANTAMVSNSCLLAYHGQCPRYMNVPRGTNPCKCYCHG